MFVRMGRGAIFWARSGQTGVTDGIMSEHGEWAQTGRHRGWALWKPGLCRAGACTDAGARLLGDRLLGLSLLARPPAPER